jgi:DNA-binding Lrp family transcriptional regulator
MRGALRAGEETPRASASITQALVKSLSCFCDPDAQAFDEIDLSIAHSLLTDARKSGRDLAKETGLSEANVSRRLARLVDEQGLRFRAWVPPALMGIHAAAVLSVETNHDPDIVARGLLNVPEFHAVVSISGDAAVIVLALARSPRELMTVCDQVAAAAEGVRRVVKYPLLHLFSPRDCRDPARILRCEGSTLTDPQGDFDQIDLAILGELQRDGRASFARMGEVSGISATAAAERFRRLLSSSAVDPFVQVEPLRSGAPLSAIAQVEVEGPVLHVASRLASVVAPLHMGIVGGTHPIMMRFNVADEPALHQLRSTMSEIRGVRSVRGAIVRTLHKDTFDWSYLPAKG